MVDKLSKRELRKRLVEDIGFSNKKASVYLSLLELGEVTASEIAKTAEIKRTTVYNILPELLKEGLIKKYKSKKKTLFYVEDINDLLSRMKEKTVGIERILPDLQELQTMITVHPQIKYYEGKNGAIQLYKDLIKLLQPGGELLTIVGMNNYVDKMPTHILEMYTKERISKKGRHRIIATNKDFIKQFGGPDKQAKREIRILPEAINNLDSELRIFSNHIAMISYNEGFMGMIIESKELNMLHKMMFERTWKTLE